jgi:hypothetical protein
MKTYLNALNSLDPSRGLFFRLAWVCLLFLPGAMPAIAQEINGTPGSPAATHSLNGQVLPAPSPQFGGVINLNANRSTPWWPPRIVPPRGAPNILLIMTDDVGFAAPALLEA